VRLDEGEEPSVDNTIQNEESKIVEA